MPFLRYLNVKSRNSFKKNNVLCHNPPYYEVTQALFPILAARLAPTSIPNTVFWQCEVGVPECWEHKSPIPKKLPPEVWAFKPIGSFSLTLQMDNFCLVVELARCGSVINRAAESSLQYWS